MATNLLNDRLCRAAEPGKDLQGKPKDRKYADGSGLSLLVRADGRKFWRFRYFFDGKEKLSGLGEYGNAGSGVSLAEARDLRDKAIRKIRDGIDPIAERKAKRTADAQNTPAALAARTLEGYARSYHADISSTFKNNRHQKQWWSSLRPVFDELGSRQLDQITQDNLIRVLRPIFQKTPESARRIKQRIVSVLESAVFHKVIAVSPAAALNSKDAKTALGQVKPNDDAHLRALPYEKIPEFFAKLNEYGAMLSATGQSRTAFLALQFTIFAVARTNEVLGATWAEISDDETTWNVPSARMKAKQAHVVALSDPARAILAEMKAATGERSGLLFPSPHDKDRQLSNMTLMQVVRRLRTGAQRDDGTDETYGDLTTMRGAARSSYATWAYQTDAARPDVIEATLAHRERDRVKAAYQRGKFENERRALLGAWAMFVTGTAEQKVVDLDEARKRRA